MYTRERELRKALLSWKPHSCLCPLFLLASPWVVYIADFPEIFYQSFVAMNRILKIYAIRNRQKIDVWLLALNHTILEQTYNMHLL